MFVKKKHFDFKNIKNHEKFTDAMNNSEFKELFKTSKFLDEVIKSDLKLPESFIKRFIQYIDEDDFKNQMKDPNQFDDLIWSLQIHNDD